ncbi:MAG: sodium-dependent bicarbonate transport family permease, partial [Schleiferiaceae bacterium]|nr:sodium-dependent bicarbonate transport family permease [Schleiferiaceae bacterium]
RSRERDHREGRGGGGAWCSWNPDWRSFKGITQNAAQSRISVPEANPGLYLPMALAISFPLNLTLGLPYYWALVNY